MSATSLSQEHNGSSESPPQRLSRHKATYAKRGKITVVACEPCRKRKTKCDGTRPICETCQQRSSQSRCRYDMENEERKLTHLRAEQKLRRQDMDALLSIIDSLKARDESSALEIFRRLRAGDDVFELAQHSDAAQTLADVGRDAGTAQPRHGPNSSSSSTPLSNSSTGMPYQEIVRHMMLPTTSLVEVNDILETLREEQNPAAVAEKLRDRPTPQAAFDGFRAKSAALVAPHRPTSDVDIYRPLSRSDTDHPSSIEGELSSLQFGTTARLAQGYSTIHTDDLSTSSAPGSAHTLTRAWTTVTNDEAHINYLISLYFSWQHELFECFPETLFRQGLATGNTNYCSELLVNAICSTGSLISGLANAHQECLLFFNEAMRLLPLTKVSSIPTIAALSLLSHVEESRGRLSSMWQLCGRSSRMALDMQLHLKCGKASPFMSDTEQGARMHSFWGAFISDQIVSFTLGRLPSIPASAITVSMPPIASTEDDRPWYGEGMIESPTRSGARATCFNRLIALCKIINSTLYLFFAPIETLTAAHVLREYTKYLQWHSSLPALIRDYTDAPPYVLCLHMQYHAAVIMLFRPLLSMRFSDADVDISPMHICRNAARAVSGAFAEHVKLYDHLGACTFQIHCLLTACTIHIVDIAHSEAAEHLADACRSFHRFAPRIHWAGASLHIIQGLVNKWEIRLPEAVERALKGDSGDFWGLFNFQDNVQAESYLPQRMDFTSSLAIDGFEPGMNEPVYPQPNASLFNPFPNQQLPLAGPAYSSIGAEGADWHEAQQRPSAGGFQGMDFAGDEWFENFVGYQG